MDWFRESAPVWVPILLGLLTAFLGGAFLTAGRLRRELTADSQLLQALPAKGRAAGHLNASIQRRVLRLVGLARYPSVAATDLLGVLGVVSAGAFAAAWTINWLDGGYVDELVGTVGPLGISVVSYAFWRLFYLGWSRRAAARFQFLAGLLDRDEVADLTTLLTAANTSVAILSLFLVVGPSGAAFLVGLHLVAAASVDGLVVAGVSVVVLGIIFILYPATQGSVLTKAVRSHLEHLARN